MEVEAQHCTYREIAPAFSWGKTPMGAEASDDTYRKIALAPTAQHIPAQAVQIEPVPFAKLVRPQPVGHSGVQ